MKSTRTKKLSQFLALLKHRGTNKGSMAVMLVLIVAAVTAIFMSQQSQLAIFKAQNFHGDFRDYSLEVFTKSSFAVMESALSRRLWELPPDSSCLRANDVNVTVNGPNGTQVVITADFDPDTKIFTLVAEGSRPGLGVLSGESVTYQKAIKIFDATDFLIYSNGKQEVNLARNSPANNTAALLGRHRKIYSKGPLVVQNNVEPTSYANLWSTPSKLQDHERMGIVVQGERLEFYGGILQKPFADIDKFTDTGDDVTTALESARNLGLKLQGMSGDGSFVITENYENANNILNATRNSNPGLMPSPSAYLPKVYPQALFCGSPPLIAPLGNDDGCYLNSPDQHFVTNPNDNNNARWRFDSFCLSEKGGKNCSNSNDFPNGFKAWRANAGLETVLFTDTTKNVQLTQLSWDHFDALKEDAQACGHYISAHTGGSYVDCDLANEEFMKDYVKSGGSTTCDRYSKLSMNSLSSHFSNFNPATYANPSLKNRFLRRVIYSEVPLEIAQNNNQGLWPSLTNNETRKNLPLWFVNPEVLRLKPYQNPGDTSPINNNPNKMREVFFNLPFNHGTSPESLKLVLLSPEILDIVSPQHIPMTPSQLSQTYPVFNGQIRPRRDVYRDYVHHEVDGYKYGARKLNFRNIVFISNPSSNPNDDNKDKFVSEVDMNLRGLWSFKEHASNVMRNFCMLAEPNGDTLHVLGHDHEYLVPTYANDPNPVVPPPGSKYYNLSDPDNAMGMMPYAFEVQENKISDIHFEGLRILARFDGTEVPGRKKLNDPLKERASSTRLPDNDNDPSKDYVNFSQRKIRWAWDHLFKETSNPSGDYCIETNFEWQSNTDHPDFELPFNAGLFTFTQKPVNDDFVDAGNFSGVEMLTIKVR